MDKIQRAQLAPISPKLLEKIEAARAKQRAVKIKMWSIYEH